MGFFGVELFFVLSGFLIGGILISTVDKTAEPKKWPHLLISFWFRRWARTIPNYFFYLILAALILHDASHGPKVMVKYALFVQNLTSPIGNFFGVSWSLSVEEWFYISIPVLILMAGVVVRLLSPQRASWTQISVWIAVCVLWFVPTVLRVFAETSPNWDGAIRKVVVLRLDSLTFGVALAALRRWEPNIWGVLSKPGSFAVGLFISSIACFWIAWTYPTGWQQDVSFFNRVLFFHLSSLGCALLISSSSCLPKLPNVASWAVTEISLISYSLYLAHTLAISLVSHLSNGSEGPLTRMLLVGLMLSLSIGMSLITYYFLELPILKLRDRWVPSSGH